MPKAAMDEYGFFMARENKIRTTWQLLYMQSISVAK
jgi:hypothetical protein